MGSTDQTTESVAVWRLPGWVRTIAVLLPLVALLAGVLVMVLRHEVVSGAYLLIIVFLNGSMIASRSYRAYVELGKAGVINRYGRREDLIAWDTITEVWIGPSPGRWPARAIHIRHWRGETVLSATSATPWFRPSWQRLVARRATLLESAPRIRSR